MRRALLAWAVSLVLASPVLAVKTQVWTQTSADDFNKGTGDGVVATSTGQLRLSRQIDALLPKDKHFDAIQAMTEASDGAIVFAAFPDGAVMRLKDGKLDTLATFEDQTVTSLAYDLKGRLLIGVGGEQAKLMRIDKAGDKPQAVATPEGVQYIWAIVPDHDELLLATGPNGQVLKVDAKDQTTELATLGGDNVTCLTTDKSGNVYAGTDTDALVYRIDRKTGKPYVLYEAAENEISALAWDKDGDLLAATSEPHDAPPPPDKAAPDKPAKGKGEGKGEGGAAPMPAKPTLPPKAPDDSTAADAIPRETPTPVREQPASKPGSKADEPATGGGVKAANDADASAGSNAVYRIDPQGFVTEIFRKPVIIYGMAVRGDAVLLATGDDGEVYELHPDRDDDAVLIRTDAPDATGLLSGRDGSLYVATSNAGQVYKLSAGYARTGTYESDVLDAGLPSAFGHAHLLGTLPEGTDLKIETRSGNVKDPDSDDWGDWSDPQPAKEYVEVKSPPARYLQYRLTFDTKDTQKTAVVDEVSVAYQKPNVAPKITALAVTPSLDPQNPGNMTVAWEAGDANDDELRYAVYVRETGHAAWMKIADDLTDPSHTWAAKGVTDGHYEIKVVASDARANPAGEGKEASRTSDAVLIDNTPPTIGDVKTAVDGPKATVTLRVVDRSGTVAAVDTTLDAVDHWQRSLPDDKMADSPEERYTVTLPGLGKGNHTLMVRATDARGNASFETVAIAVP